MGLDRDQGKKEATSFIEMMMRSNHMAVIATFTDPGHQQCYDCGYGHDCVAGNVYKHMGLTTRELAQANRPEEYGIKPKKAPKASKKCWGRF